MHRSLKKSELYNIDDIIVDTKGMNNFPLEVFPEDIQEYLQKIEHENNINSGLMAGGILFATSVVLGNKLKYAFSNTWVDSPMLWIVIIDNSGGKKSQALKLALKYLRQLNKDNHDENELATSNYNQEYVNYMSLSPEVKRDTEKPEKPASKPPVLVNNTTTEGLARALSKRKSGIGLYYQEFSGFFTQMNQYKGGKGSDLEFYLALFDGNTYNSLRSDEDNNISIENGFSPIIGGIQPKVINEIAQHNNGKGFYQRFLYLPIYEKTKNRWDIKGYDMNPLSDTLYDNNNENDPIYDMLENVNNWNGGGRFLTVSANAAKVAINMYLNYIEEKSEKEEAETEINKKMQTYFGRILAVLTAIHNKNEFDIDIVKKAMILTEWFRWNSFHVEEEINASENLLDVYKKHNAKTNKAQIIALYRETHLNQKKIAEKVGVSAQYVGRILKDIKN